MSGTAQTFSILAGMAGLIGLQSFWIARQFDAIDRRFTRGEASMDARFDRVDARFDAMDRRFDRLDDRLDVVSDKIVAEHGERLARLESRP